MERRIALVFAVTALSVVITFTAATATIIDDAYAEEYSGNGFSIAQPDGWIQQQQQQHSHPAPNTPRTVAEFLSASRDAVITIYAYDNHEYPLASIYRSEFMSIPEMNGTVLESIANEMQKRCRLNLDGPCWNYDLVESKITTAGDKTAGIITYGATADSMDVISRVVIIPDKHVLWVAEGTSHADGPVDEMLDAAASFHITRQQQQQAPVDPPLQAATWTADPDTMLERRIQVNLIMIGGAWSEREVRSVSALLPEHQDPVYLKTGEKTGIRYHYHYEFISRPDHAGGVLKTIMDGSYETDLFGKDVHDRAIWQELWAQQYGLADAEYRLADAEQVESYIMENVIWPDPDLADPSSANLVFLDIGQDVSGHIRSYYTSNPDAATGRHVEHVGLMGYGGNHNMYFYDLWAVPWIDYDEKAGQYTMQRYMIGLHDCKSDTCRSKIAADHASSALQHIVTPPLLYPVEHRDKYRLDVLLYLKPGGSVTVTPATLDYFLSEDALLDEMRYLYPLAEWEIQTSIERRDLRGLSYDFKRQFEQVRYVGTPDDLFGNTQRYALLSTDNLTPYLAEWGESRQEEGRYAPGGGDSNKSVWNIPILIVIDSSSTKVLFDNGLLGLASGLPDDELLPCCALGVAEEKEVWEERIGITGLILHEAGHLLGLAHPFTSQDTDGKRAFNGYYNWYASPMTYALPALPTSCGFLYSITYDEPCGNGAASFTAFEQDAITGARVLSALNKASSNIEGLDAERAKPVTGMIDDAVRKFESGDLYAAGGALATAIKAYEASLAAEGDGRTAAGEAEPATPTTEAAAGTDEQRNETEGAERAGSVPGAPNGDEPATPAAAAAATTTTTTTPERLGRTPVMPVTVTTEAATATDETNRDTVHTIKKGERYDIQIPTRVSNLQEQQQDMLFTVQVVDTDGFVVHLESDTYSLGAGGSITPSVSWAPDTAGAYTVKMFAWDIHENPLALSHPATILIRAE